jgi:hypothetical protein
MGKHSASAAELELISRTLNTLRNTAAYGTTNFSEPEFALIDKFLGWPAAKLFPVLDIHRLLILHPRAAEHYVAVHSRSPRFLDDLLARLQVRHIIVAHISSRTLTWLLSLSLSLLLLSCAFVSRSRHRTRRPTA